MTDRWRRKQEQERLKRAEAGRFQKAKWRQGKVAQPQMAKMSPFYEISLAMAAGPFGRDYSDQRVERVELVFDPRERTWTDIRSGRRLVDAMERGGGGGGNQELRQELEVAKAKLVEQNTLLQRLATGASPLADVVMVNGATTYISAAGQLIAVNTPDPACAPGDQVKLVGETMQIREKLDVPCSLGDVTTVAAVYDDGRCEIKHNGSTRLVVGRSGLEAGDRVVLDKTGQVVTKKLKSAISEAPLSTGVSWDDIAGCDDAKRELVAAIELPYRHRDLFAKYGQNGAKGVLLHGPPGNGKTLLAKAVATAVAAVHGAHGGGFISVKGPELLDRYVGATEENFRGLFEKARAHKAKHGYPAVIFIDEADAVLGARGTGSYMSQTVVPTFLAEMDGMGDSGAFVLLATNRPDSLDPAAVRDGRIDRRILVPRPNRSTAAAVFHLHLSRRPTSADPTELADAGVARLFSDDLELFGVELKAGGRVSFALSRVISGAMIAGVVNRAAQFAIERAIADSDDAGIGADDISDAIAATYREQMHVDHRLEMNDMLELLGEAQRITRGGTPDARAN